MVEIQDTLVSLDLFKECFCCDLAKCHGICCVEGDAGAPVTIEEVGELEDVLDIVWNDLSKEARKMIDEEGVVYPDRDGELVTSIINGKDCVFTCYDNLKQEGDKGKGPRCCFCAIDRAFREGKTKFQKPISCALYPVRLSKVGDMTAVNYHRWEVCKPAVELGRKLQLPVYKFLKEPLIRRFGQEWWDECDLVAGELKKAGYLD